MTYKLASGIVYLVSADVEALYSKAKNDGGNRSISVAVVTYRDPDILLLLSTTVLTNGTLAILIATRLLYAHSVLSTMQSDSLHSSSRIQSAPYLTAMAICVESSAIIFVAATLGLIAIFVPVGGELILKNSALDPGMIMTQLCVSYLTILTGRSLSGLT
jgi:hypothetical protein